MNGARDSTSAQETPADDGAGSSDSLRVWLLSDGMPGHYNQARAIAAALARVRALELVWIDLRLRLGLARRLMRSLLNRTRRPLSPTLLMRFYRGALPAGRPDVLVSAGGRTSFANAWLAREFGVPNFYAGSLRGLSPRHFTAVMTLEPIPGADNNVVLEVPLSRIDAGALPELVVPAQWRRPCWALLAGGDGAGYRYTDADWRRLVDALAALAQTHEVRWLIAGSRRTGPTLPALLAACGDTFVEETDIDPAAAASRLPTYLAAADKLFVTEDSMSMLSEAIGSGKPVFSLSPARARPDARYAAALNRFECRGLIRRLTIVDLAACDKSVFETFSPPPVEPSSQWLAQRLASWLPKASAQHDA